MTFTTLRTNTPQPHADAIERARVAAFTAGYDAAMRPVVLLSDDPDWLAGFFTGRSDNARASRKDG